MSKKEKNKKPVLPESVRKARVYAMPEKFHVGDVKSEGKNSFLIIGIIILAVALLSVGGYFLYQQFTNTDSTDDVAVINENTNDEVVDENNNLNNNANDNVNNANSNSNENANDNVNNANSNSNENANDNVNNSNSNLGNINLPTNNNINAPINVNIAKSQDTDFDNLTDIEEILYGTSISVSDTDGDGFPDGQELVSGYNPNGTGDIESSSKISDYSSLNGGYSILYPEGWVADDDPQNENGKIFSSEEEFVVLDIQENPAYLSAKDWYITKSPGIDSSGIKSITNWTGKLSGVKSADGLTVYYAKGNKVYILNYNINLLSEANYFSTFEMMYKSFDTSATTLTNTNTNSNLNTNSNTNLRNDTDYPVNINTNTNTNFNTNYFSNTNTNTNTNSTGITNNFNSF